jgi:hypothetical protein
MKSIVYAEIQVPGFHSWPDAPDDLAFLREEHRHLFLFRIGMESHQSRQFEFFKLQQALRDYIEDAYDEVESSLGYDFGNLSCEEIAQNLLDAFRGMGIVNFVEVSEDQENGAIVYNY